MKFCRLDGELRSISRRSVSHLAKHRQLLLIRIREFANLHGFFVPLILISKILETSLFTISRQIVVILPGLSTLKLLSC